MTDYWLPTWWGWIDNWDRCSTCIAYNGSPCTSCEIPPGLLGMVCLVGGGTATVAGNCRGNATIVSSGQARGSAIANGTKETLDVLVQQERMIEQQKDMIRRNTHGRR